MSDSAVGIFRKNYVASFGGGVSKDPIYAAVIEGIRPQGIEHYLPLFYANLETVFDYIGPDALVALDGLLAEARACLLYTSPSPRDKRQSRMPSSA